MNKVPNEQEEHCTGKPLTMSHDQFEKGEIID